MMKTCLAAWRTLSISVLLLLAACAPATAGTLHLTQTPTREAPSSTAPSPLPLITATGTPSLTPAVTSAPPTESPSTISQVCSPLEGISIADLSDPDLLKTLFQAPRPGQDDGHHGADFAYWSRGERTTMQGHPVLSVLDGRVAAVMDDRPPYGNMVIIETPFENLPPGWVDILPTPAPTLQPPGNVYCPPDPGQYGNGSVRSLYLLYAHLQHTPTLSLGESVRSGQTIGEVGTTGKSVNPHLHLETRTGPAGATFAVMAHYDNAASEEEMRNYCTWRISGLFQMLDPMALLK